MKIESAQPGDKPRIKRLLADCNLPVEDITASHLEHFLIMRRGQLLQGVIGLQPKGRSALLRSLAVPKQARGQGRASALVQEIETYARAEQIETLYLLTTTAEGFFSKKGYRVTNRSTVPLLVQETDEFKSICPSTAACMEKSLTAEKQ